jgi:hypothetical protein
VSPNQFDSWSLVVAAALIGLSWAVVTWLQRRCWHEWEQVWPSPRPIHDWKYPYDGTLAACPKAFRHLLRCKHCGMLKCYNEGP